jgi:endonuclease YncB( thermonuclease family)
MPRQFLASLLMAFSLAVHAETLTGRVVYITEGDTLTLEVGRVQQRIRLAGIDAPERGQSFGSESQANLGRLAFQQTATADCRQRDSHGRRVCVVRVKGLDLGLQQIADGMAWWSRHEAGQQGRQMQQDYAQAETMARLRRFGLWRGNRPTPPWDWRKLYRH